MRPVVESSLVCQVAVVGQHSQSQSVPVTAEAGSFDSALYIAKTDIHGPSTDSDDSTDWIERAEAVFNTVIMPSTKHRLRVRALYGRSIQLSK